MFSFFYGRGTEEVPKEEKKPEAKNLLINQEEDPLEQHKEEPDEHEQKAGFAHHSFTDLPCLLVFLGAVGGLAYVLHYAHQHTDMRRLSHGIDFLGNLCGTGRVENATYLYYCSKGGAGGLMSLDLEHPLCVPECPSDSASTTMCLKATRQGDMTVPQPNTFEQVFHFEYQEAQNYPTYAAGGYCFPQDTEMMKQMASTFTDMSGGEGSSDAIGHHIMMFAHTVQEAEVPILASALLALVLSWAYLFLLRIAARVVVYSCLLVITLGSAVVGGLLIYSSQAGVDEFGSPEFSGLDAGDATVNLWIGIGLCGLGAVSGIIAGCASKSINMAIASVELATQCMFSCPSLLLVPFLTIVWQVLCFGALSYGFLMLVACGKLEQMDLSTYAQMSAGGMVPKGVSRSFTYDETEWCFLLFYAYMIIWFVELANALSQFTLAYVVQLWYFSSTDGGAKSAPAGALAKGAWLGIVYHLGSLAFGSAIISAMRLFRYILSIIAANSNEDANPIAKICLRICMCCMYVFEQVIRYLNKNAYMYIAMKSQNFFQAAKAVLGIMATNITGVAVLNGACWIAQLAGIGAITAGGSALTYYMCRYVPTFNDPSSGHFVAEPLYVAVVAGMISSVVAWTFMTVFDTVADCLFLCFCVGSKGSGSCAHAPEELRELAKGGTDIS